MKKIMNWAMAAALICGASVFTACTNDTSDNPTEQAKKNRKEFIEHTRKNLKEVAENLNFSTWTGVNILNQDFNKNVLTNPAFDKTVSTLFSLGIQQSIKPVEESSELAQMGYQLYAVVDFTAFNFRFTQNADNTGFDVEPAEDFELIYKRSMEQPALVPDGVEMPPMPDGEIYDRLVLKASGSSVDMFASRFSTSQLAVIIRIPSAFEFSIDMVENGQTTPVLTGTFKNEFVSRGTSSFINPRTDAWNISGTLQSNTPGIPENMEIPQNVVLPGVGPQADATTLTFAIGQDPTTHEAGVKLGFVHNDRNIVKLRGVMKNLNGQTDYSQHTTASSIAEAFAVVMAGNSLEEGTITLLDDLTTTLKVSDCSKVIELQSQMARARRNYADQQTIEQYTQQLNQLVSASMTCQGLNDMQIPMKLETIKFGVDYWAVPALNFADENGYVPLTDMLDKESIEYMINIADHAADPMKESLVTVRQLMQYLQTLAGTFKSKQ